MSCITGPTGECAGAESSPHNCPVAKTMFLSHSSVPAGAELYLLRLLASFESGRALVVLAAPGPMVEQFEQLGIEVHVIESDPASLAVSRSESNKLAAVQAVRKLLAYGWKLGKWARNNEVDLVTAWTIKSLLYGFIAARRAQVPLVWCVNDRMSADYLGRPTAFAMSRLAPRAAQAIMVNSRATLDTLHTGSVPVLVAPPGIETAASPPRLRTKVDSVVMVGRIAEWKGQAVAIRAFHAAFADSDVELCIVGGALFGETDYAELLRDVASEGPCADRIHFAGHVQDVQTYLDRADVMIHASIIPEPFGAVVLEGMSSGLAVIATTPGGPAEVITDGRDGLLVPCGSTEDLTRALVRLQDDPKLVESLSAAAVGRAAEFDMRALAPEVSHWIDDVRDRRAEPMTILVREPRSASRELPPHH